jgi:hypothetical protein
MVADIMENRSTNENHEANKHSLSVAPLTKVTLDLEASPGDADRTEASHRFVFSFVCGLGTEGLTAFESELQGLSPGDRTRLRIESQDVTPYFEHLSRHFLALVPVVPPFELAIHVASVRAVSERELIRALAEKTEAGCGDCNCGCGCGET